jgi:tetratricopeptide (TPR) repeat protein
VACPALGCGKQTGVAAVDKAEQPRQRRRKWPFVAGAGCLALLFLNPISLMIISVSLGFANTRRIEAKLQQPEICEPAARRIALLCQSDLKPVSEQYVGSEWLPNEVAAIVPHAWGSIDTDHAFFEFGGGFYHFGYMLQRDAAESTPTENVWHLFLNRENQQNHRVTTVRLAPGERLSRDELLDLAIAGYERQANEGRDPEDSVPPRIQVYLRFDKVDKARSSCREMLVRFPDDWWVHVVNALVTAETESVEAGERSIRAWVESKPDYFRWLDLAYFYQLEGLHEKAADAMKRATAYDANTSWGHGGNSEHRGYTAALYAYQSGHYAEAAALCDHLLPVTINGNYAKGDLRSLKSAAEAALRGDKPPTVTWVGTSPFDPFQKLDLDKLLGRTLERPRRQ